MRFNSPIGLTTILFMTFASTANAALDELVVEAQRREQPIQDVPLAVSGFSTEDITKLQIHETIDIGANVPNLQTYAITANGAAMQLHARGASVQNPGFNVSESPVGLYIDDMYHGRLATANLDLNDIERIEVLRGPQGTLYGRNTIAGAIKAYSRTPDDDFWANASVGYGKYETTKVTASVGGPIQAGALAASISGLYHDRGEGYMNYPVTSQKPGKFENKAVRGKLHWYGTDNYEATLTAWAVDVENDGYNGVPYVPFQLNPPAVVPPGNTDVTLNPIAAANGTPLSGFYDNLSPAGANFGSSEQSGVTLDMTWTFGGLDLRSITGYADIDDDFGFDLAGGGFFTDIGDPGTGIPPPGTIIGPLPGLLIASGSTMETWTQEFQLLGKSFDDRLSWIAGLYYLSEEGKQNYRGNLFEIGNLFTENSASDTTNYAAYVEGTWNFTDRISLTGGARWSKDEKKYDLACTSFGCAPATDGSNAIALDKDWDDVTGKISLNSEIGDNLLMYLSVASGFQAGGFQTLCFGNLQCAEQVFDPQEVISYEYGFKSDWFENTLRANIAVFYADYSDIQQTVPRIDTNGNLTFPTENVGDVGVLGAELEATWIPLGNWNIFGNFGWMDSDDVSVTGDFGPAPPRELPSNPDFTFRVGSNYTINVISSLDIFFGADVTYSDEYFNDINNSFIVDDYTRVNGFVGAGRPDGRWQVVGEWKNIFNEEDNVSGLLAAGFTNVRTVLPPLEYMITLKVNY